MGMTKDQLEEVWEEQDHMDPQDWDPKTFFNMHDLDGNGQWDENEVRVLFKKELDKAYDPNAPEDDMREREEEMERMRDATPGLSSTAQYVPSPPSSSHVPCPANGRHTTA